MTIKKMPDAPIIEPKNEAPEINPEAAPESAEQAPEQPQGAPKLPDKLIHIPAIQGLIAGAPPAISANIKDFSKHEYGKLIAENKDLLTQAGLQFYRSLNGEIGVLFNAFHIAPQDIQAADKAGKLHLIAPSFNVVNHAISKAGLGNPTLKKGAGPTGGFKTPTLQAPPQAAGTPPPAAPPSAPAPQTPISQTLQRQLMAQRGKTLQEGPPSTGPAPGAGRLLNQILKPVV